MADISTLANVLIKLDSGKLDVHPERCVRVRHRLAQCELCALACSSTAIKVEEGAGGLTIEPSLCTGCGNCTVACPTEALVATDPTSEALLAEAIDALSPQGVVYFACPQAANSKTYDMTHVVEVPCLGRIDETVFIGLVVAGAKEIYLVEGACEACETPQGHDLVAFTMDTSNYLLTCFGKNEIVSFVDSLPEDFKQGRFKRVLPGSKKGVSRRDFFDQMSVGAKSTAIDIASSSLPSLFTHPESESEKKSLTDILRVSSSGQMIQHVAHQRLRLLMYLDMLGEPKADTVTTTLWGRVEIDPEKCKSCRMCATFCPTGALWRVDNEGAWGLAHLPTDCVNCKLCETACFNDVLKVHDDVSLPGLLNCEITHFALRKPGDTPARFTAFNK